MQKLFKLHIVCSTESAITNAHICIERGSPHLQYVTYPKQSMITINTLQLQSL